MPWSSHGMTTSVGIGWVMLTRFLRLILAALAVQFAAGGILAFANRAEP